MTAAHHRFRAALCTVLSLLALAVVVPAIARAQNTAGTDPEVLRGIHTDVLHTTYADDQLKLWTRIGLGQYREADPAGLVFNLEDKGSARLEIPDLPAFAFLGRPGDIVWTAPEREDPELIWPGWDTESIPSGALKDNVVELSLLSTSGPGKVEVFFNYDPADEQVTRAFSSADPTYQTLRQPVGEHVHANWAFTALGTYKLVFEAKATTAAGTPISSGPVEYTFVVGPYVPPTPPTTPTTPPTTPSSTPPTGPTPPKCVTAVLSAGHVDVAARTVRGGLRFQIKDGTQDGPPVWRDPGTVAFQAKASAATQIPDDPAYRFLGSAGAPIWVLPQAQDPDLLWAGWNTEEVDYSGLAGPVRWSLDRVEGPGKVAVFQIDGIGQPIIQFDSGKTLPQSIALAEPTHAHANWTFTEAGVYKLTFTYSATTTTGQRLSDTATLPFVVGDDLTALCPGSPPPTTRPTQPTQPTRPPSQPPTTRPTTTGPSTTGPSTTAPTTRPTTRPTAPTTRPAGQDDGRRSPSPSLRPCVTTTTTTSSSTTSTTTATTAAPTTTTTNPATTTTNPASTTLTTGHADYAVRVENGRLVSRIKDGTQGGTPVWRQPGAVTVRLGAAAATQVPAGAFGFLGSPGAKIWQIPQTQKAGVVWLGWNTEEVSAAQVSGTVDWRLDKVEGPGRLAIFEFDTFGRPKVIFSSADGLPDTYRIRLGTHAHGNWAFTKPGRYRVTFTHSATLTSGGRSSDTATLTFDVGTSSGGGAGAPGPAGKAPKHGALGQGGGAGGAPVQAGAAVRQQSAGDDAQPTDCRLASTGTSVDLSWIAVGAVAAVIGVVLLVATRRRRSA